MEWNEEDRSVRREMEGDIYRREWIPRTSIRTFDVANMKEIAVSEQDTVGASSKQNSLIKETEPAHFQNLRPLVWPQYSSQMAAQRASLH
jgi:hypothetical protein